MHAPESKERSEENEKFGLLESTREGETVSPGRAMRVGISCSGGEIDARLARQLFG